MGIENIKGADCFRSLACIEKLIVSVGEGLDPPVLLRIGVFDFPVNRKALLSILQRICFRLREGQDPLLQ